MKYIELRPSGATFDAFDEVSTQPIWVVSLAAQMLELETTLTDSAIALFERLTGRTQAPLSLATQRYAQLR